MASNWIMSNYGDTNTQFNNMLSHSGNSNLLQPIHQMGSGNQINSNPMRGGSRRSKTNNRLNLSDATRHGYASMGLTLNNARNNVGGKSRYLASSLAGGRKKRTRMRKGGKRRRRHTRGH